MKRTFICIGLLGAMVFTGAELDRHTGAVTAEAEARLAAIAGMTDADERAAAAKLLSEDWERFCAENIYLTNNECAFEISRQLVHIAAEARHERDDIAEECEETAMLIEIYDKSRALSIENVF